MTRDNSISSGLTGNVMVSVCLMSGRFVYAKQNLLSEGDAYWQRKTAWGHGCFPLLVRGVTKLKGDTGLRDCRLNVTFILAEGEVDCTSC